MPRIPVRTGTTLNYEINGDGEPLLLIMGTSGSIPLWADLMPRLAERHRVIAFDNRGLGGSERGEGPITVASLAEDAAALLEALDVPSAHAGTRRWMGKRTARLADTVTVISSRKG